MAYESTTYEKESEGLKERAQQVVDQARVRGGEVLEDTADVVRRHPGKTLAISVIVGGILGAVIVNAIANERETNWDRVQDRLQDFSEDALKRVREGAAGALSSLRNLIDAAAKRFA